MQDIYFLQHLLHLVRGVLTKEHEFCAVYLYFLQSYEYSIVPPAHKLMWTDILHLSTTPHRTTHRPVCALSFRSNNLGA